MPEIMIDIPISRLAYMINSMDKQEEEAKETAYLLQNPVNAKRLMESIEQLESDKGMEKGMLK